MELLKDWIDCVGDTVVVSEADETKVDGEAEEVRRPDEA